MTVAPNSSGTITASAINVTPSHFYAKANGYTGSYLWTLNVIRNVGFTVQNAYQYVVNKSGVYLFNVGGNENGTNGADVITVYTVSGGVTTNIANSQLGGFNSNTNSCSITCMFYALAGDYFYIQGTISYTGVPTQAVTLLWIAP